MAKFKSAPKSVVKREIAKALEERNKSNRKPKPGEAIVNEEDIDNGKK